VDDETKILVVPLPESKRAVKVVDTKYDAKTYGDLLKSIGSAEESLSPEEEGGSSAKRYDDKTEEELEEEMARKRK